MTSLAARTIEALRHESDVLTGLSATFTDAQLTGPSGASEWTVAQVLSHLGSGSEIALAGFQAALGEREVPGDDFNPSVWARWDAMSPGDQRDGFIEHNRILSEVLESLTPEQHESVQVPIGFLPAPLSVAAAAGMRLNEVAHHSWDVRVAVDPEAGLLDTSAAVLPEHLQGGLGFLLGFIGKADALDERVVLAVDGADYTLVIDDAVSVGSAPDEATATFAGPAEAAQRLISGRLLPAYTPGDVVVSGNVTLDQLRQVFPGF